MAQENINYGAFPDDPLANTIRDAFIATQNNFDTLFAGSAANANVSQIVAGTGISVSPANGVGNVTVTSTFNSLRVRSNTISLSSLGGTVDGNTLIIPNSNATLILELSGNTNANSGLYNLNLTNNLTVSGSSISAPNANITLSNGNVILTNGKVIGKVQSVGSSGSIQFSDANGVMTGSGVFTFDTALNKLTVPSLTATQITGGSSNIANGIFANLAANSTVTTNLVVNSSFTGNTATFSGNITASSLIGNITGNLINPALANTVLYYSGNGNSTGSANLTYNGSNLVISNGNVIASTFVGNLIGTASSATNITGAVQANISELGNLNYLNVFGNTVVGSLLSNSSVSGANMSFVTGTISQTLTVGNVNSTWANVVLDITARNINANANISTANIFGNLAVFNTSVTANSVIFNAQTSAPTLPVGGTVYYNSVTGKLQVYNAVLAVWQDLN